jgi:hypothetical protein
MKANHLSTTALGGGASAKTLLINNELLLI